MRSCIICLFCLILISCTQEENPIEQQVDVYLTGTLHTGFTPVTQAVVWKNGKIIQISDGTKKTNFICLAVLNNDLYVGGNEWGIDEFNRLDFCATYWKNGIASRLGVPNPSGINVMCTSDKDLYIGYKGHILKNGQPTFLFGGETAYTPISIDSYNKDMYVLGWSYQEKSCYKVWKNGIVMNEFEKEFSGSVSSMCIKDNNIYVAGTISIGGIKTAVAWKNGEAIFMADKEKNTSALSIQVLGDDVYVGGYENELYSETSRGDMIFWKNGIKINLLDTYKDINLCDLKIIGEDIYIAGTKRGRELPWSARLWKNGIEIPLECLDAENTTTVTSLTIVSR